MGSSLTSSESAHQELRRRVLVAVLLVAALAYFRVEVRVVRSPLGESAQRNVSFGAGDLLIAWDSFSKTKRGKFALMLGPGRSGAIPAAESTSLRGLRDSGIVDIWSSELGLFHPNVEPTHVLVPPRMLDEFSSVIGGWRSRSGLLQHAAVRAAKASSIVITPSARAPLIEGILRQDLFFTYDASKVSVKTFSCNEHSGTYDATQARAGTLGRARALEVRCARSETLLALDVLLRLNYESVLFLGMDYTSPLRYYIKVLRSIQALSGANRRRSLHLLTPPSASPRDNRGYPLVQAKEHGRIPLYLATLSLYVDVEFFVAANSRLTTISQFLPSVCLTNISGYLRQWSDGTRHRYWRLGLQRRAVSKRVRLPRDEEARLPWFRKRRDGSDYAPPPIHTQWSRLRDKRAGRECVVIVGSGASVNKLREIDVVALNKRCAVFGLNLAWLHPHLKFDYFYTETERNDDTLAFREKEADGMLYWPMLAKSEKYKQCCHDTTWISQWSTSRWIWPSVFEPGNVSDYFRDMVVLVRDVNLKTFPGPCKIADAPKELPTPGELIVSRCSASITLVLWIVAALGFKWIVLFGFDYDVEYFFLNFEAGSPYRRSTFDRYAKLFVPNKLTYYERFKGSHKTSITGTPAYVASMLTKLKENGLRTSLLEPNDGSPLLASTEKITVSELFTLGTKANRLARV